MFNLANYRVSLMAWLCVSVCGLALGDDPPREAAAKPVPERASIERERTGIIDMAHVFKNYARFVDEREKLKKDLEQADTTAKLMAKELKELNDALQKAAKGTPEYTDLQAELARRKTDLEIFRFFLKR